MVLAVAPVLRQAVHPELTEGLPDGLWELDLPYPVLSFQAKPVTLDM